MVPISSKEGGVSVWDVDDILLNASLRPGGTMVPDRFQQIVNTGRCCSGLTSAPEQQHLQTRIAIKRLRKGGCSDYKDLFCCNSRSIPSIFSMHSAGKRVLSRLNITLSPL